MKQFAIILAFAAMTLAQDTPALSANPLQVDCTKVESLSACASFNEMVYAKDKDLLSSIQGGDHTFVCFRTSEDVFIVISLSSPYDRGFAKPAPGKTASSQFGRVRYKRYKDGISEYIRFAPGTWTRETGMPDTFETKPKAPVSAYMNDDELGVGFSYPNAVKTITDYSLTLRRSTLRFVETYEAKDAKPTKPDYTSSAGGHCTEFPPNSK